MSATQLQSGAATDSTTPRERELRRHYTELVADARRILELPTPPPDSEALLLADMVPVLEELSAGALGELRGAGRRSRHAAEVAELALRGADVLEGIREYGLIRRKRALAGVESALGRMRCMSTADELIESVCAEIVRSCGFKRAMLSRVTGDEWMPWMAHFTHREVRDSDRGWMANGRIPLKSMPLEKGLLEDHRPTFSADARNDPRVSKQFVTDTGSISYAAASIFPAGRVVGFLHADHYPSPRRVDEVDCYVLGEFAAGFGRVFERVALLERLQVQRVQVRQTLEAAETIMDNLARAEVELARQADERSMVGGARTLGLASETAALDELLTPREREVIALIVSGQSNGAIAERLVISEGTVKSHVKQILRKLGAVNRSEVIARYLGMLGPN
jgi:DNA-binding CsgD family transcriptional regulator